MRSKTVKAPGYPRAPVGPGPPVYAGLPKGPGDHGAPELPEGLIDPSVPKPSMNPGGDLEPPEDLGTQ